MRKLAVFLSLAGVLPFAASVRAHGADWELRVLGQSVGGYEVTVRTAPKEPRIGHLHMEVQLMDPVTLSYVERASVTATARLRGGTNEQAGPARARFRKPWHEIDMMLKKSGSWDVDLAIDGPRARGHVSFRVDVSPGNGK
jgi:hypothetical protein